ncbi:MAG: anthranilate phosphoribosyltransferase [Alphaproteobacteria bacterium]|nr:anthranilate phosphoribosyltransferase [Alphaproteobacteria bacterium]MBO6628214.1 anthranilate phosphoribosyltransferase [Alphaproteobacteria bacterium]MDF1625098.1 anthranilate phosphoribosyltransferase [Parvibaculaceae bacterium]
MTDFKSLIAKVADGHSLSALDAEHAFEAMMSGDVTSGQIGGFLMALRVRGETIDEITAGAKIMRAKAVKIDAPAGSLDTCGTGGDASGTYNISTAASFAVAACGVPVAKHGNKALSSKSGSAEVLEKLGVRLDLDPAQIKRCIVEAGIGFMFAPAHHSAMKYVGPTRAELGTRTIFNLLGPLSNPAGAPYQVMGVFAQKWVEPLAQVLKNLGSARVWVVHGSDGLDELTTTGPSFVAELKDGKVSTFEISPEDAGLTRAKPADLKGGDPEENTAAVRRLLDGEQGAYHDIVVLNAAASLVVAGKADTLKQGVDMAAEAIASGAAREALAKLVSISNEA